MQQYSLQMHINRFMGYTCACVIYSPFSLSGCSCAIVYWFYPDTKLLETVWNPFLPVTLRRCQDPGEDFRIYYSRFRQEDWGRWEKNNWRWQLSDRIACVPAHLHWCSVLYSSNRSWHCNSGLVILEINSSPRLMSCQENAVLFQKLLMSVYISQNRIMESGLAIIFIFSYGASWR